jgi:hypothetical protein
MWSIFYLSGISDIVNSPPKALEEVFHAWREQVTGTLGRQDIQATRIIIERFIIHIIQSMPSFRITILPLIVRQG